MKMKPSATQRPQHTLLLHAAGDTAPTHKTGALMLEVAHRRLGLLVQDNVRLLALKAHTVTWSA